MKTLAILITVATTISASAVDITIGVADNASPPTYYNSAVKEGMSLMDYFGGEKNIKSIVIAPPRDPNAKPKFSKAAMVSRFKNSVCTNSKRSYWFHAKYTHGTIYFKDGRQANFKVGKDDITITKILFTVPKKN